MEYARGFHRPMAFVLMSLLSTCAAAAGGFVWQWNNGRGQPCTEACDDAGLMCVKEFSKIDGPAAFEAAKGAVSCDSYETNANPANPAKGGELEGTGKCTYGPRLANPGTCAQPSGSRLCSCQCAAGTFSTSDLQPYPCTRYDKIPTLPSHLRLRKARPTQLFLSLFFSSHNLAFAFFRV